MSIETQYAIGCIIAVIVMGIGMLMAALSWTDLEDDLNDLIEEEDN